MFSRNNADENSKAVGALLLLRELLVSIVSHDSAIVRLNFVAGLWRGR